MEEHSNRYYKCFIAALVGICLIMLDLSITIGNIYPVYQMSDNVIWEYQYYNLNLHYGTELESAYNAVTNETVVTGIHFDGLKIDILNDYIGYVILIMAFMGLVKRNKMFGLGVITAAMAVVLEVAIDVLPFVLRGETLCHVVLFLGIAAYVAKILVVYSLGGGMAMTLTGIQFKGDRKTLVMLWFGIMVLGAVAGFTRWLVLGKMTMMYNIILFFVLAGFIIKAFTLREYIAGYRDCGDPVAEGVGLGYFKNEEE